MDLCRTCMAEQGVSLVPVYSKLDDAFIANIIMECTAIQIHENDGLPAQICHRCMESLQLMTTFVKTARECDRRLRKLFKVEYLASAMGGPEPGGASSHHQHKHDVVAELDDETDIFQFTEVKIEPLEGFVAEGISAFEQEQEQVVDEEEGDGGASSGSDQDYDSEDGGNSSSSSEDGSDSESGESDDWKKGSGDEEKVTQKKVPKRRGPKPKKRPLDSDDKPLLNSRRPKYEEDFTMNEYERELFTEIEIEQSKHVCCGCLLVFDTAPELETHRARFHTRKRDVKPNHDSSRILCDCCLRKYKSKRRVNYHKERVRQLQIVWECNKCKNRFSEATRRRTHAKKHPRKEGPTAVVAPIKEIVQQELGWLCCAQACGLSFPSEKEMLAHAVTAHQINKQEAELEENQDKPIQCKVCYRRFYDKNGLIHHQQRLYKLQKYQCALCGLQFNSGGRLTEHELTHQNEKPFKCEVCDKSFTQKGNLKTHMTIHSNEKPFQCTVCGMAFRQKGGLKTHMSNHIENPQFKCEVCAKMFKAKLHLRYHMRIHNGEKPFPCRYCEKAFTDFTNRMRHEMSHTGIKPYKCSFCEKSFIRKRFLMEHESTHTGVKMYNCDVCHQSFGQKNSLKKHIQTTHPSLGGGVGGTAVNPHHEPINSASASPSSSSSSIQPIQYLPPQTHPIPLTSQIMSAFQFPTQ